MIKPFLRWAGGKSRIVKHLLASMPDESYGAYWEPFLGSAALFFALGPRRAYLSDSNRDLVSCYGQVRDRPGLVFRYLEHHLRYNSERYYYDVRAHYNKASSSKWRWSAAQAARFIYLNRASFNGIFRVNLEGDYNVPYGRKEPPPAPSKDLLETASGFLRGASLAAGSYDVVLNESPVRPGDFVYLDPPYPPLNSTAKFTHYTRARFSWRDHRNVADLADRLRRRGCFVMISNTSVEAVRELYAGWHLRELPVTRWVAADGSRRKVADLVITSYPIDG